MSIRICNFPKPDGSPCGSPALHDKKLCYFHNREHKRRQYAAGAVRRADVLGPRLPRMKSFHDIRSALTQIYQALLTGSVPLQRAGARLFDLQQTSRELRTPNSSPKLAMQPYTAQYFTYNSFVYRVLHSFPPILLKTTNLPRGRGWHHQSCHGASGDIGRCPALPPAGGRTGVTEATLQAISGRTGARRLRRGRAGSDWRHRPYARRPLHGYDRRRRSPSVRHSYSTACRFR